MLDKSMALKAILYHFMRFTANTVPASVKETAKWRLFVHSQKNSGPLRPKTEDFKFNFEMSGLHKNSGKHVRWVRRSKRRANSLSFSHREPKPRHTLL